MGLLSLLWRVLEPEPGLSDLDDRSSGEALH